MDGKEIKIDNLFFQFMSKDETKKKPRLGYTSELDDKVHRVYADYISQIAEEPYSRNSYDIFEISERYELKTKSTLAKLQRIVLPDEEKEFNELSAKLVQKYLQIDKSPVAGVFFVVLLTYKGERFLSILKLDWVSESWTEFDSKTTKMTLHEVLEALPGPNRFRKGALFPHPYEPSKKYMKVFQGDNPADFFDEFLGGAPRATAFDVMTEMRFFARKITGEWPNPREQIGLYDGLEAAAKKGAKRIDPDTAIGVLESALPTYASKVKDAVESEWKLRGTIDPSEVEDLRIEFLVGGIKLGGSIKEFRQRFEFEIGGNSEKHRITGRISNLRHVKK